MSPASHSVNRREQLEIDSGTRDLATCNNLRSLEHFARMNIAGDGRKAEEDTHCKCQVQPPPCTE